LPAAGGLGVPALPAVVDRATWQAQLDGLLVREKAHTREGDAIAAARRRLPMVEVDPAIPLIGEHGPVPLARDVPYATFCQGPYDESIAYRDFMGWDVPWYSANDSASALLAGRWFGMQVCYLHQGEQVFETYWNSGRAAEALAPTYALLDMAVYGRQETWEDSPPGWPQPFGTRGEQFRTNGRPTAQWSRLAAGHSDDLGTASTITERQP
jgi:predicted dithiol-disulfide oxidoreductase (DUF899 family)